MCLDRIPPRLLVRVQQGSTVADAVARHRDRTGYGGTCVLVFESASRALQARTGQRVNGPFDQRINVA
jgi:hypothetical protein